MQEDGEMMEFNEQLTDGETMRAIRYLDPDLRADKAGENTGIQLTGAVSGEASWIDGRPFRRRNPP
jgi:hypothetical protein